MDGNRHATLLRLEGRLTRGDLVELETVIRACRHDRRRVVIDLAGIGFLDASGASALVAAQDDDVELVGASPFVQQLLEEVDS
ncbi:MAG TPA: STAS domain-containing protein [Candidatus Binatia bacterium]|jgi:anti-anti-sigma regulatory factor